MNDGLKYSPSLNLNPSKLISHYLKRTSVSLTIIPTNLHVNVPLTFQIYMR